MARGNRGLQQVRTVRPPAPFGGIDRGEAAPNENLIPQRAVLIEQQDRRAVRPHACIRPRRLNLHQRHETVHFRFVGHQAGKDAPQPQRVLTECRPHPVVARCRRVALVEDEINHFEHRRQPHGELVPARHLERDAFLRECLLCSDDALRDGRLGHEERACDLVSGQTSEESQRERDARLRRQHRVARGEDQPQQVIADVIVECGVEIGRRGVLRDLQLVAELLMLALEERTSAQLVDRPVLRRGHEPRAWIAGNARLGPLLRVPPRARHGRDLRPARHHGRCERDRR